MNPLTDLIFSFTWIVLFAFALRSIIRGWSISRDIPMQGYSVEKKTVSKIPHPEMTDVKNGDELLVVKFGNENKKDPLLKSLQERIDEIQEDDEDDDGDIIVRI